MKQQEGVYKNAIRLTAYLFVVWGFYRLLFILPEEVEELIIKPIIWLLPVAILVKSEKLSLSSLGITTKKLFPAIYMSLGLGAIFAFEAVLINFVKYGGFEFAANIGQKPLVLSLGISFVTAFTEEITFRGYLFNRLWKTIKKEWLANLLSSFAWALLHIPIVIFVWKLNFAAGAVFVLLTTLFGIGSAFLFARTENIVSSILLHVLWSWPIILFR